MDAKLKELYAVVKEQSDAAKKAKAMGLVSKGYGRWADPKTDKVVAQTKKGKLEPIGGDKGKKKATKQDVDSDMYAQDTWDKFGGDTGTDADFQGEPPEGAREPDDDYDPETGEFTGDDEFALSGTDTDDPAGGRGDAWMHGDEEPKEKRPGGKQAVDDSRRKAVQSGMALKKAEGEFGMDSPEYEAAKGADDEAQGEYQQAKASQEQRQKDINSGKAEPENKEEADLAAADARDSVEKQKQNRAYALQQPDPRDPRSPAEQEAGWDKTVADAEERAGEAEAKAKEFGSSRTGTELNQETLTIDGKQFRRISEGVEKQPKPKYEFSEFYQRFKR